MKPKYRWEFTTPMPKFNCTPKTWRVLVEVVKEAVEITSAKQALSIIGVDHPAMDQVHSFLCGRDPADRLEFAPWMAFTPSADCLAMLGADVVKRVEAKDQNYNLWASADGWTWRHVPGDSGA